VDVDPQTAVAYRETSTNTAPTYLNLQFKLEMKL